MSDQTPVSTPPDASEDAGERAGFAAGPDSASPGERLRAARERRGRSQADIAGLLRLQTPVYAALEAEDYERLGAPVYVRGHLRAAAAALDLSGDELAHAYALQLAASEAVETEAENAARPLAAPAAAPRARVAVALALAAGAAAAAALTWHQLSRPPGAEAPAASAPAGGGANADTVTYRLEDDERAPNLAQRDSDLDRLSVRFASESWIQVKDLQQRLIYEGWHRRGDHPQINGRAPFNLVIGSVDAIEAMTMNDVPVEVDERADASADGSAVLIIGDPNASDLTLP